MALRVRDIKSKAGRPTKLTPEMITEAVTLAKIGFSLGMMADIWMVDRRQVERWAENNEDFARSIKKGQAEGIQIGTACLIKAMQDGNPTAIIFFLKNRAPELWRDRREEKIEHTIGAPTWTEQKNYVRTLEDEKIIIDAAKALEHKKKKEK